ASMPTSEGQDPKTITLAGGWALSIPENADAKDETFEFIKHLMDPEVYTDAVIAQGNIATRQDVAGDETYSAQPFKQIATEFLESAD
ncbi:extracellular solute-binding protein, partial [Bacteroides xylanisolvens]